MATGGNSRSKNGGAMYENHTEIIKGMCVLERDGHILMCERVKHPSGEVDAVPKYVIKYPAGFVCESYAYPRSRKRVGGCALCSIPTVSKSTNKKALNPIKASKRN